MIIWAYETSYANNLSHMIIHGEFPTSVRQASDEKK